MPKRAELTSPNEPSTGCPSKQRTPSSGIANWPASEFASIRPGARSMSCRAAARADRSALPSAGMASSPSSRRANRRLPSSTASRRGENPVAAPPEPAFTVADLAERYMEAHVAVNCNAHTQGIYRGSLDNNILPALGAMPIASVGRSEGGGAALRAPQHPRRSEPCAYGAVQDVLVGRGLGAGSGWRQPLPFRAQVQGRQARAISHGPDEYRRIGCELCVPGSRVVRYRRAPRRRCGC